MSFVSHKTKGDHAVDVAIYTVLGFFALITLFPLYYALPVPVPFHVPVPVHVPFPFPFAGILDPSRNIRVKVHRKRQMVEFKLSERRKESPRTPKLISVFCLLLFPLTLSFPTMQISRDCSC